METKTTQDPVSSQPATFFAPDERASGPQLKEAIAFVLANPIMEALLNTVGGLLLVLNEQRQIIGLNQSVGRLLGVEDVADVLGLRLGEAVHCVHAWEHTGGCGTSRSCAVCGAVVAIMACLGSNQPAERNCSLTVHAKNHSKNLFFKVRACPLTVDGHRVVALILQDATDDQRRANLERVFFEEISGTVAGVLGRSKLLLTADQDKAHILAGDIFSSLLMVAQEIRIQRRLVHGDKEAVFPVMQMITLAQVGKELHATFDSHPVAQGKHLRVSGADAEFQFKTDICLLMRVLVGMVMNAFEASTAGDTVQVTMRTGGGEVVFGVWNKQPIPVEFLRRIFEQNFSTKPEAGRGMGTYCMKLLGEETLGGKVDFTSTPEAGTEFRLTLKG